VDRNAIVRFAGAIAVAGTVHHDIRLLSYFYLFPEQNLTGPPAEGTYQISVMVNQVPYQGSFAVTATAICWMHPTCGEGHRWPAVHSVYH